MNGMEIINTEPLYEFEGVRFSLSGYFGPIFINKDGADCKRPTKAQWETFTQWSNSTKKQQRKYRI